MRTIISLAAAVILVMTLVTGIMMNTEGLEVDMSPPRSLTSHSPITIEDDSEFTSINGVTSGTGTESDPYVISDWLIDGSTTNYGIYISNTSKYFIIQNCTIHGADSGNGNINLDTPYDNGIFLYNVEDSIVRNNILYGNGLSDIRIAETYMVTLEENICQSIYATTHILVQESSNNTISRNILDAGLSPTGNNPANGSQPYTQYGVFIIYSSSDNIVSYNSINNHSYEGIKISNSGNTRMNIHNNKIKWNVVGMEISGDDHMVIDNLIQGNNKMGIDAVMTYKSNFLNNDISYNGWEGMYIIYDTGAQPQGKNTIKENIITYNLKDGIVMRGKEDHVENNAISFNSGNGISVGRHGNIITSNNIEGNTGYGVEIDHKFSQTSYLHDNEVHGNNFIGNGDIFQARDAGFNNTWNTTTIGNYWDEHASPDANSDGIVDLFYYVNVTNGVADEKPSTTLFNITVWGPRFTPTIVDNIARSYQVDNVTTTSLTAEDEYIGTDLEWKMESNASFFRLSENVLVADPSFSDIGSYWLHITVEDNKGAPRHEIDDINITIFVTTSGDDPDNGSDPDDIETDPGDDPANGTDPGEDPGNGSDPGEEPGNNTDPDNGTDPGEDPGNETDPGEDPGNGTDPSDDNGNDTEPEDPSGNDTEPWTNETNNPPSSASINIPEEDLIAGKSFTLSASSFDPDMEFGDELIYSWNIDGNIWIGKTISVELPEGEYTVILTVTDSYGEQVRYTTSISVDGEEKSTNYTPLILAIVVGILLAIIIASLMIFRKKMVHDEDEDDVLVWEDPQTASTPKILRSEHSNFNSIRGGILHPSGTSPASIEVSMEGTEVAVALSTKEKMEVSELEENALIFERSPRHYRRRELKQILIEKKGELDRESYRAVRSILYEE